MKRQYTTDLKKLKSGQYYLWLLPSFTEGEVCCVWAVLHLDKIRHVTTPPRLETATYHWTNPLTNRKATWSGAELTECIILKSLHEAKTTVTEIMGGKSAK